MTIKRNMLTELNSNNKTVIPNSNNNTKYVNITKQLKQDNISKQSLTDIIGYVNIKPFTNYSHIPRIKNYRFCVSCSKPLLPCSVPHISSKGIITTGVRVLHFSHSPFCDVNCQVALSEREQEQFRKEQGFLSVLNGG